MILLRGGLKNNMREHKKVNKQHILIISLLGLAAVICIVLFLCGLHIHHYGEEIPVGKTNQGYLFIRTCDKCDNIKQKYYDSIVTFIDDDGKTQALLHWEKIIDATGIKMTSAIIPGKIGETTDYDSWYSYAGWDLLNRMQEKGIDFVHHTYNHKRLTSFTEEQLHDDFQKSIETLSAHGIDSDILVYPFYDYNETVISVASIYFDYAFAGNNETIKDISLEKYALTRIKTNDPTLVKTITFDENRTVDCLGINSIEKFKKEMKTAIKDGSWLVYVTHAYDSPSGAYYFDEESEQTIIEFCKYIQSLSNVKIVTATEGVIAAAPLD